MGQDHAEPPPRPAARHAGRRSLLRASLLSPLVAPLGLAPSARPARAQGARDSLTIGITQYPSTLHPNIESMMAKAYALGFVHRPLTAYGPDWKLQALGCETLPSLENGLAALETTPGGKPGMRVTWRLREGWLWGDGTPVTAEDFRFAWEAGRSFETGFGNAEFYRSAYEFLAPDPRTVTLRLDRLSFDYGSAGNFVPLPAHLERARWEADRRNYRSRTLYDTDSTNPGLWCGPYRVTAVQPGSGLTLERNEHWNGPAPAFRRILLRAVENTAALEAQLLAGQIDMVPGEMGFPLEQALALEKRESGRFRLFTRPGLVWEHIDLRLDNPVLADRRVRQALLCGMDRARIAQTLYGGRQPLARSAVHPDDPMYGAETPDWPFDPKRAQALLEEAGWKPGPGGIRVHAGGERLSLEFNTTAGNRAREQVQQIVQGMWKAIGAEARIRNEPPRVLFGETLSQRRFTGAALFAWVSSPENVPRSTLHSSEIPIAERNWSGQNYPGFRDAETDALLEALPQELDPAKRRPLWARLQAITATELPALPLWHRAEAHVWPLWLSGVEPTGHLNPSSLWVTGWKAG
ncbi:Oligopeptide-binding protein oppA [Roseomonas mucosa]|uniref:Stage 0 sporulation protein KA n=5 Tax=Roseomonas mucosa TaxID=207340 RepID=A0A379N642_9PROT|nr:MULTISPECIES: peptide ABC transporter substrate-binding protein [Roseomonas]MCG7350422.1 peptide ABC transporter substrate-binding protein [Roseomonas mucosa]MCG7355723.1 peptide ABC transporter substrate-binding protein [Roseomonas mucosa]MDT8312427.1 peptide ABC transporter substrate-binding protein [Roseomonas mucosa]MDT8348209.1 peptide ABC transporter substrate-binding protein [Roseomonas mucosa]MDT8353101.1 peptide ABC transporter substrate-binding protein [Roseomonas mucosa]